MHATVDKLTRFFAILGGIALSSLILLTCISILGRSLNSLLHTQWIQSHLPTLADWLLQLGIGPINGDFELVEAGMAFAIFAFLPMCQLYGAHAFVSVFTSKLPAKFNQTLVTVIEIVFAVVLILIAFQLFQGMVSKRNSGQVTFLLEFPVWWAYALSLSGAVAAAIIACYVALVRLYELFTGKNILPQNPEAAH